MKTATSWYRLGLRGRLFMAFGVVAAPHRAGERQRDHLLRQPRPFASARSPKRACPRSPAPPKSSGPPARSPPPRRACSPQRIRPNATHALKGLAAARQDLEADHRRARRRGRGTAQQDRRSHPGKSRPADAVRRRAPDDCRCTAPRWSPALRKIASEARRKTGADGRRRRIHPDHRPADRGGQQGSRASFRRRWPRWPTTNWRRCRPSWSCAPNPI